VIQTYHKVIHDAASARSSTQIVVATRAVGRAAAIVGRRVATVFRAIDPDLLRYLGSLPVLWFESWERPSAACAVADDGERIVVLVHGLGGSPGNFGRLRRHLRTHGRQRTFALRLPSGESIEALAARLAMYLDEVVAANGAGDRTRCVDLVGHSMGGIVARLALEDDRVRARVGRVVTLATPHAGTWIARLGGAPLARALRPTSPLFERLRKQEPWPADWPPLTAVWSRDDVLIAPPESGQLAGAASVEVPGFSHLDFLRRPAAWAIVRAALSAP
jgi:triacylglycerol lipase